MSSMVIYVHYAPYGTNDAFCGAGWPIVVESLDEWAASRSDPGSNTRFATRRCPDCERAMGLSGQDPDQPLGREAIPPRGRVAEWAT